MREESFTKTIESKYGRGSVKLAQDLQKTVNKSTRTRNHIKFLKRCRDNNIIPKGLRIKLPKDCLNIAGIMRNRLKIEQRRLSKQTQVFKKKLAISQQKMSEIQGKLKDTLRNEEHNWLEQIIEISRERENRKVKERQLRKFNSLIEEKQRETEADKNHREDTEKMKREKIKNEVIDLTKDGIDEDIEAYLSLGPDFCEAPTKVPVEKIITTTEDMCYKIKKKLEEEHKGEHAIEKETDELRDKVSKLLINTANKKFYTNLNKEEQRGKKKIKEDKERVYIPADKGRIMVAMDRYESTNAENSYEFKMKGVLQDLKATESTRGGKDWDLTKMVSKKGSDVINEIKDRGEITEKYANWLKPKDCHAPRLSGYPKIHKPENPLRGVVSMIGSPYEKISKHLSPILRTIQGRSGLYIKNSRDLKEIVKEWRIERNETLVSYDVKNLYPSIPIKKALELIENLLLGKSDLKESTTLSVHSIMKLLNWIFQDTYCEYSGRHYVLDSAPIGLGVTGEIAVIYMEEFQMIALKTLPTNISSWPWYVDDSETKCKNEDTEKILQHLNTIEPNVIIFTKEESENDSIAVLDLKQTINRQTKKIECTVNYKATHTNINVKEQSNHPESMKRAIILGFAERARALCDEQHLQDELENIEDIFVANGFKRGTVREYMSPKDRLEKENGKEEEEDRGTIVVPYLKGFSEKFKRIARKYKFRVAHTPGRKVKETKKLCQEPLGQKNKDVVYKIPCGCEKYSYIGETWRKLETRLYEHKMGVRMTKQDLELGRIEEANKRLNKEDGGLPRHNTECAHEIKWEGVEIVGMERNTMERKVLESIETKREETRGNRVLNNYKQIPQWNLVLNKYFQSEIDRGGT